jgi:hypothetical protein
MDFIRLANVAELRRSQSAMANTLISFSMSNTCIRLSAVTEVKHGEQQYATNL